MTLVEVMVAFSIFTLVAGGLLACMLQAEKSARSNLARAYAETTAQSIMEQIVRVPTSTLMNSTQTTVDVLLASLTSTNQTVMEEVQVPWSSDATTFTALGGSQGILTDAAYIAATNKVRPERYMKMRINLQRTVNTSDSRVAVVLRYQWEIPDRKSSGGSGIYLTDEIRTVRSSVSSF
jgi:hypothetical protein